MNDALVAVYVRPLSRVTQMETVEVVLSLLGVVQARVEDVTVVAGVCCAVDELPKRQSASKPDRDTNSKEVRRRSPACRLAAGPCSSSA